MKGFIYVPSSLPPPQAQEAGGKGRSLAIMAGCGLAVPPAFIIPTGVCRSYFEHGVLPKNFLWHLARGIDFLNKTGRDYLCAVRSGAAVSMPGMMDTLYDIPPVEEDLVLAIQEVMNSWNTERARSYREDHKIPNWQGTAVTIQKMVDGRKEDSGTGVCFSHNFITGEFGFYGYWIPSARGNAIVQGEKETQDIPFAYKRELEIAAIKLAAIFMSPVEIEFTVQEKKIYYLQCRKFHLAGQAAVNAVLSFDGLVKRKKFISAVFSVLKENKGTKRLLIPDGLAPDWRGEVLSPGVAAGPVQKSSRFPRKGDIIHIDYWTSKVYPLLREAAGILSSFYTGGGSHIISIAREQRIPAVVIDDNDNVRGNVSIDATGGERARIYVGLYPVVGEEIDFFPLRKILADYTKIEPAFDSSPSTDWSGLMAAFILATKRGICEEEVILFFANRLATYLLALMTELRYSQKRYRWIRRLWSEGRKKTRGEIGALLLNEFAKSRQKTIQLLRRAEKLFVSSGAFSPPGFGGQRWAEVAHLLCSFLSGEMSPWSFIDQAIDIEHNNGRVTGKFELEFGPRLDRVIINSCYSYPKDFKDKIPSKFRKRLIGT